MKKLLLLSFVLCATLCHAQRYYPGLDDIFINNDEPDETVFYDEIAWFKEGLKTATKKVWMNGLQTSVSGNSAFYGLDLVPKWVYEVNFLDTGMILKYNHAKDDKTSYIPLTCTETIDARSEEKSGKGRIQFFEKGGVALEFPAAVITPYSSEFKTTIPDAKCLFEPKGAEYVFDPATKSLTINLTGDFTTGLKMGKTIIASEDVGEIVIHASKGLLTVSLSYTDKKKGAQTLTLITKKI